MIKNGLIGEFVARINDQTGYYKALLVLLNDQQKLLASGKTDARMEATAKKQEEMIEKISAVEKEKQALLLEFAKETGLEAGTDMTIGPILEKMEKKEAEEIWKALTPLMSAMNEAAAVNSKISRMMKNYVDFSEFSENMKKKLNDKSQVTYTVDGEKKVFEEKKKGFDSKI